MRTKEGLAIFRAAGTLRGRSPKLSARQEAHLAELHATGTRTPADLAHLFGIGRSTVYRAIARAGEASHPATAPVVAETS